MRLDEGKFVDENVGSGLSSDSGPAPQVLIHCLDDLWKPENSDGQRQVGMTDYLGRVLMRAPKVLERWA